MEILKRFSPQEKTKIFFMFLYTYICIPGIIRSIIRLITTISNKPKKINDKKVQKKKQPETKKQNDNKPQQKVLNDQKSKPNRESPKQSKKEQELDIPSLKSSLVTSKLLNTQHAGDDVGEVINQPYAISEAIKFLKSQTQESMNDDESITAYTMLTSAINIQAQSLPARTKHSATRVAALLLTCAGGPNVEKFESRKVTQAKELIRQALEILKGMQVNFQNQNEWNQDDNEFENEFWAPQADGVVQILISKLIALANGISRLKLNLALQNTQNRTFTETLLAGLPGDTTLIIQDINGEELFPLSFIDACSSASGSTDCFSSRFQNKNQENQEVALNLSKSPNFLQGRSPRALKQILQSQSPIASTNSMNQLTKEEAMERFPWIKYTMRTEKSSDDTTVYNVITRNSKGGFLNIFGQFAPQDSKEWCQWIIPQRMHSLAHYGNVAPIIRHPEDLVSLQLTRCIAPDLSQLTKLQTLGLSYVKNVNPQHLEKLKSLQVFFAYNIQIINNSTAASAINSPSLTQSRLAYGSPVASNQDLTKSQLDQSHLQNSNFIDVSMCPQKCDTLTYLYNLPQLKRIEIYNCQLSKTISINTMPTSSQTSSLINGDIFQSLEVLILRYNACLRNVSIRVSDGALKKLKTIDTTAKLNIENRDKLISLEYIYSKNQHEQDGF